MARAPDSEKECGARAELYLGPASVGVLRAVACVDVNTDDRLVAAPAATRTYPVNATVLHLQCDRSRHDDNDHAVVLNLRGNEDDLLYGVMVTWRRVREPAATT